MRFIAKVYMQMTALKIQKLRKDVTTWTDDGNLMLFYVESCLCTIQKINFEV